MRPRIRGAAALAVLGLLTISGTAAVAATTGIHAPPAMTLPGAGSGARSLIAAAVDSLSIGGGPAHGAPVRCSVESGPSATCGAPSPGAAAPGGSSGLRPDDTELATWINVTGMIDGAGSPETMFAHMAFDPTLGAVVLFGGCTPSACPDNETWEYTPYAWQNLTPTLTIAPSIRLGFAMDYDPALGGVVVEGGTDGSAVADDVWLFSGHWSNITATTGPGPATFFGSAAWDPALGGLLVVDGCLDAACGNLSSSTSLLGAGGWSLLGSGPGGPTVLLSGAAMAFDPLDGYMVEFGGNQGGFPAGNSTNWTYTYAAGAWTNRSGDDAACIPTCGTPPGREYGAMTWDGEFDLVFLSGGYNRSTNGFANDSWLFVGGEWYPSDSFGAPAPSDLVGCAGEALAANSSVIAPFVVGGLGPPAGCANSDWVWEIPPELANASVNPNPVDDDAVVTATGDGTAGDGSPASMAFVTDWGDGATTRTPVEVAGFTASWASDATHIYGTTAGPGSYPVSVHAVDYFDVPGSAWTFTVDVRSNLSATWRVANPPAVAGLPVAFVATGTGGAGPYSYSWTFGDGTTQVTPNATTNHTFGGAASYSVSLAVTDAGGGAVWSNSTVAVVSPFSALATIGYPTADVGIPIAFNGTGVGGVGPYASYAWTFGDGTTASGPNASHTFAVVGNFSVGLEVTDAIGSVAYSNLTLRVNPALAAAPTASMTSVAVGETIAFAAGASGGSFPYLYSWEFG
ncbi:MAG TPA: PKD domain-containing protein, partial [Thermoplasmata archaeon]|nr:PKD domain-containing protein [Thermoplasmata archaeon]